MGVGDAAADKVGWHPVTRALAEVLEPVVCISKKMSGHSLNGVGKSWVALILWRAGMAPMPVSQEIPGFTHSP